MKKHKALIIENERNIPEELENFITDNKELFESIDTVYQARFYPEDVHEALKKGINAIVGHSQFVHYDQLETMALSLDSISVDYTFFFHHITDHLNDFVATSFGRPRKDHFFKKYNEFMDVMKKWVLGGLVYDIGKDPFICHDKVIAQLVQYDEVKNFFYLDGQYERFEKRLKFIHSN